MRKGRLNKPEIARLARAYQDLDAIIDQLPKDHKTFTREEEGVWTAAQRAHCAIGALIRWQDFPTMTKIQAEKAVKKAREGVAA